MAVPGASCSASTMAVKRLVPGEQAARVTRDDPVPLPSAAAGSRNSAVAMTRPSISRHIVSLFTLVDMGSPSGARGSWVQNGSQRMQTPPDLPATPLGRSCR